jgi:hypothetical protein
VPTGTATQVGTGLSITPPDASDNYVVSAAVSLSGASTTVTCTLSGALPLDSRALTLLGSTGHGEIVLSGSATLSTATSITVSCLATYASGALDATSITMTAIQVGSLTT